MGGNPSKYENYENDIGVSNRPDSNTNGNHTQRMNYQNNRGRLNAYNSSEDDSPGGMNDFECKNPFRIFCDPYSSAQGNGSTNVAQRKRDNAYKLMGSPLIDPPSHVRQRQHQNPKQSYLRSSMYSGIEKEESSKFLGMEDSGRSGSFESESATIHDGPTGEQELLQKYELREVLGVGSTSTCHKCVDRMTGKPYACKIIDKGQIEARFRGMIDQFHSEIDALRRLHHPNIIHLRDVYVTQSKIFIVMELMEGGEMFDYVVEKGTLTEEEASFIVRKVTSALVYMHSKNIIHRDLKPENLLLTRKPRGIHDIPEVKIIDFGLSKCMNEPVARSFLGTRGYLAPEMLQRREYTRSVDAWSLGVITFVLLCGCLPFDDDSQTVPSDDVLKRKFVLRFPRWAKNLSPSAKDLLSHLLDINPKTRYTAEQALKHPWVTGEDAPSNSILQNPGCMGGSPGGIRANTPIAGVFHLTTTRRLYHLMTF
mmetsp:Transcript_51845/g.62462  ORF Transcript_51845/g.62462 Transcript_51845/m.62462 type:complete len:481 (+) Transcript_51845:54-1496(+)